jgi:HEAT repeat protein
VLHRRFSGRRLLNLAALAVLAAAIWLAIDGLGWREARVVDRMVAARDFAGAAARLKHRRDLSSASGARAVRRFGIAVLRQGLHEADEFERCFAATGLAGYGDWSGMPAIEAALASNKPMLQRAAIDGLAEVDDARALDLLRTTYRRGGPGVRVMVAQALANSHDHRALPILLEATRSADPQVRLWSVRGLGGAGDTRVLGYLHGLQGDEPDAQVNTALARSVLRLGDRSLGNISILETALYMNDPAMASDAALALGDARDQIALNQLHAVVDNREIDLRVRLAAAVALTRYGDSDGMRLVGFVAAEPYERDYLTPLFNDLDVSVGRSVLIAAMSSEDVVLRLAAIEAIGRLGGRAESSILMQALRHSSGSFMIAQIAWSLGRIGAPGAIFPLLDLAASPDATVRDTAADALARIATARLHHRFF